MEESKNLTLFDWSKSYKDTEEYNKLIVDTFVKLCNKNKKLKSHRDFIEESQFRFNMIYGHGHRSLQYLWKLLVDEMPDEFKFLEIGVYKGQILSLVEMLSNMSNKKSKIFGITPLFDPDFVPYNRGPFIENLYKQFGLSINNTKIYDGKSNNESIIKDVKTFSKFDMVYIDGDHSYDATLFDINTYSKMIKEGGFLIIDDCNTYKNLPEGMFRGINTVSDAVVNGVEYNNNFTEILTCMHVRVWKKVEGKDTNNKKDFWNSLYE